MSAAVHGPGLCRYTAAPGVVHLDGADRLAVLPDGGPTTGNAHRSNSLVDRSGIWGNAAFPRVETETVVVVTYLGGHRDHRATAQTVQSFERSKPARRLLPEHLPLERVVYGCAAGLDKLLGSSSKPVAVQA
jgi:hypothetical protein